MKSAGRTLLALAVGTGLFALWTSTVFAGVRPVAGAELPGAPIAAGSPRPPGFFKPLRTNQPPVIDGRLDDPVWRQAPSVSGFKTFIPDFDREPSEKTTAYMAYDAEYLYFAFKCYDREPDKIKAAVAARDTIRADDFICINLDTFNDQQSLYAFYVNPLGIQTDSRFASGQEDFSVDFVWMSAGRIDPDGYSVELAIPFKSIRYSGGRRIEMSIFFERSISRRLEHDSYPPLDPKRGYFFLTQMMPLELVDIKHYTLFEGIPAFTVGQKYSRDAASGVLVREKATPEISFTGKYGLTSQLILDGTWNPDFSQIEADAGQVDVNLRYDLFYPEKRPFFLEGREMFLLAGAVDTDPLTSIVHTRTIVDPRAGVKISGKLSAKDTVASIFALDEAPSLDPLWTGGDRYAGDAVFRYKRALSGDSYLGGFYTGRKYGSGFNQVAGLDGQARLSPSSLLSFYGFGSWTRPAEGATTAPGHALGVDYLYDTRNLGIDLGAQDISRGFQTETGYLTRNGLLRFRAALTPRYYPDSRVIRKVTPQLFFSVLKDEFSGLAETYDSLGVQLLFPGNMVVTMSGAYATEIFLAQRFNTSGGQVTASCQATKQLSLRAQFWRGNAIRYVEEPFQGYGSQAAASVIYQPSDQFNLTLTLTYADLTHELTRQKVFDDAITRGRLTYQMNKYLFFRTIVEYNSYYRQLLTDFLASFTYVPGTVIQFGYGSLYNRVEWADGAFRDAERFLEMRRGLFFKASYLWRL